MDVAPRYKLLTLLTPLALLTWLPLLTLFKLSTLLTLFILLKLLHCTMCTLYSTIALWSKPEIQKPLSQFLMLFLDPRGPLVQPSVGPSVRPVPR